MRDIKFRVWDKENKRMLTSEWITVSGGGAWYIADADETDITFRCGTVDNASGILLQYTGLKDAKNREIYEGDIIEVIKTTIVPDFLGRRYKVIWRDVAGGWGAFALENQKYKEKYRNTASFFWYAGSSCKVIGNIWENPELIK